jgi:hypothetical protein
MKGTILSVDVKNGSGVIHGENYLPYKFDMTGWNESNCYPVKGMAVNFEVGASFSACKITIDSSKSQSTKKLASKKFNKLGFFLIAFCLLSVWVFSKGISFLEDYQKKNFSTVSSPKIKQSVIPSPTSEINQSVISSPTPNVEPTKSVDFELESETAKNSSMAISSELETVTPRISEATKLANRRNRWKSAEKCLQALLAINGNVETLCSQNLDIYELSQKKDGIFLVSSIIKEHLDAINQYEKHLNEGIISTLPKDEAMTSLAYFNSMQAYHKLAFSMLESQKTRSITCVYSMELGEKTQQECDAERTQYEQEAKEKEQEYETVEKQIDDYKKNYKPDP